MTMFFHAPMRAFVGDVNKLKTPTVRDHEHDDDDGTPRIRCPLCAWEPKREDLWMCSCGHVWHTFDTFGQCPACSHQWQDTMCFECHEWSKHRAWYAERDDDSRRS